MRKPVLITVGVLGFIGGSAMTGSTLWAVLGPIIVVVGIALALFGSRRSGSKP